MGSYRETRNFLQYEIQYVCPSLCINVIHGINLLNVVSVTVINTNSRPLHSECPLIPDVLHNRYTTASVTDVSVFTWLPLCIQTAL